MEKWFVLGVDLDGVCADFYKGIKPLAAEWLGVPIESLVDNVKYGMPEWGMNRAPGGYDVFHRFAVNERNLFRILEPIKNAPQALRRLAHNHNVRVRILTHRLYVNYIHQTAVCQTVEWLDRHDIPYWDLCFMPDKSAVFADLFVDDSEKVIKELQAAKQNVVIFSNSTNVGLSGRRALDWNELERMVLSDIEEWQKRTPGVPETTAKSELVAPVGSGQ